MNWKLFALMAAGCIATGVATWYTVRITYQRYCGLCVAEQDLKAQCEALEDEVRELRLQVEYYTMPYARQKLVREKLQMGYPRETIYMY